MKENPEERFEEALKFAKLKHSGQERKDGSPAIIHPISVEKTVREKGGDIDCRIAALFHDLLEDTDASEKEIEAIGGERVLKLVKLLTKKPGYVMREYVNGILSDKDAVLIKGADRLHNLRSALLADEKFRLKYIKETEEWYMDFLPEIPPMTEALRSSLMGSLDLTAIVEMLIITATYDSPVSPEMLCKAFTGAKEKDIRYALEAYTDRILPLNVTIRKKDGGYYAELPFSETDIIILRAALHGNPYCEKAQADKLSERLSMLLPWYMRETNDNNGISTERYPGTFYDNITALIKALYPLPDENGETNYKKVTFRTCDHGPDGTMIPRTDQNGCIREYKVNPLKIFCKNNSFYLLTYSVRDHAPIKYITFRIDRITDVKCTDEDAEPYESGLSAEQTEMLKLKDKLFRSRFLSKYTGNIYPEPEHDPAQLNAVECMDSRGFSLRDYFYKNSVMFVDRIIPSARIKVKRTFMNTMIDTFGYDYDLICSDDTFCTIQVHNVAQNALVKLAVEFEDMAEITDNIEIREEIRQKLMRLTEKYKEDSDNE